MRRARSGPGPPDGGGKKPALNPWVEGGDSSWVKERTGGLPPHSEDRFPVSTFHDHPFRPMVRRIRAAFPRTQYAG